MAPSSARVNLFKRVTSAYCSWGSDPKSDNQLMGTRGNFWIQHSISTPSLLLLHPVLALGQCSIPQKVHQENTHSNLSLCFVNFPSRLLFLMANFQRLLKTRYCFTVTSHSVSHTHCSLVSLVNQRAGHVQRDINRWAHHGNDIKVTTYRQALPATTQKLYIEFIILPGWLQRTAYQTASSDLKPVFPDIGDFQN